QVVHLVALPGRSDWKLLKLLDLEFASSIRRAEGTLLLRKNALFYKNEHGASVGAILQSLIETCRLNSVGAWEYLLALMRNRSEARANPAAYLPWSYAREEPEEECELRAA